MSQERGVASDARRKAWVRVICGSLDLDGKWLHTGDGVAIRDVVSITIVVHGPASEILLFDRP